jgi:hypothetical protein
MLSMSYAADPRALLQPVSPAAHVGMVGPLRKRWVSRRWSWASPCLVQQVAVARPTDADDLGNGAASSLFSGDSSGLLDSLRLAIRRKRAPPTGRSASTTGQRGSQRWSGGINARRGLGDPEDPARQPAHGGAESGVALRVGSRHKGGNDPASRPGRGFSLTLY